MNFKYFSKIFIVIILIFGFAFVINNSISADEYIFNYSKKESIDTKSLSVTEIIEKLTDSKLSDAEYEYLKNNKTEILYEGKIPMNSVNVSLVNNVLTIHADKYSYTDINNRLIVWTPYSAQLNNDIKYFFLEDNLYNCEFTNVLEESEAIEIVYKTSVILQKDKINTLINEAYNVAEYYISNNIIENETLKYEQAYVKYQADLILRNNYLKDLSQFESDMILYNNYLNELKIYNLKKEAHDKYLIEKDEYQLELERYNKYLLELEQYNINLEKYNNYLIEKDKYAEIYEKYDKDLAEYNKRRVYIDYGLEVMKLIQTPMTKMERTIYNAVMGDSVTQVLNQKDLLYSVGVDTKPILSAEEATYKLREIFTDYFNIKDDEDKYIYYRSNFSTIRTNLTKLLKSLENLYKDSLVNYAINDYFGKGPQYRILIAQLVLVVNAMHNSDVKSYDGTYSFNSSWSIDGLSMEQVLENDYNFVDNDKLYFPLYEYPEKPEEPGLVEYVEEPIKPTEVSKPVEPTFVEEPTAPQFMAEPVEPTFVGEPVEPVKPVFSDEILNLINEYNQNILVKRNEFDTDVTFELTSTFIKKFRNAEEVTIVFYDLENNMLTSQTVQNGSYIVYDGIIPTKPADKIYSSYIFSHWEYADGTILDLNNVTTEGFVHPVFKPNEKQLYKVTWNVDGIIFEENYEYGEIPVFKENTKKQYIGNCYYEFIGWDKEIVAVEEPQTYKALYEEYYLIKDDLGYGEIIYNEDSITINTSLLSNKIDLQNLFNEVITNEETAILLVSNDYTISISKLACIELINNNIRYIEILINSPIDYEYNFTINLYNSNNELSDISTSLDVEFNGQFSPSKSSLYLENVEVRSIIENKKITINNFMVNKTYLVYPKYSVILYNNSFVVISANKDTLKYGEEVQFEVEVIQEGVYIDNIIILDSNNRVIDFTDDYKFLMPRSDVYIIVSYEFYNYTIKFISDGNVISSKVYRYGDTVKVPTNPKKASDEEFSYEFSGWDKEITVVTQDEVYTAVFTQTPIEKIEYEPGFNIYEAIKIGIIVVGIGTIIGVALLVLKKKKLLFFKK